MALDIGKLIRFMTVRLVEVIIVLLLIMFMPNIPPYCKISDSIDITPSMPLEGKLALNERLNDVVIWHKSDLYGPEAFADYNGELYTSLQNGDIVKLTTDGIIPVAKLGKPCNGFHEEKICGRPLGMQFDKDGSLIAADAYYGIFRINVETGDKIQLISPDIEINGKRPKLPNGIAVASNGDIFWTDSSTEFYLEDGVYDTLADGSGRLIHYDIKTKQNTVLVDKLLFANGIALSDDEEFIIVAESGRSCVHRYYLKGPKKGTKDIFIDGLPGIPDNITPDGQGGFLLPLLVARDTYTPLPPQILGPFPLLRKLVARMIGLSELGFTVANQIYQHELFERAIHLIGHFSVLSFALPRRATIVHVSRNGEILDSIHGNNKKAIAISEARIFNGELYLGSPFNDYIGRISLNKVGLEYLAKKSKSTHAPTTVPTTIPPIAITSASKVTSTAAPVTKPTQATTPAPVKTPAPTKAQAKTKPLVKDSVPDGAATPKPTETPKVTPKPQTVNSAQPKPTVSTKQESKSTTSQPKPPQPKQTPPSDKKVPK